MSEYKEKFESLVKVNRKLSYEHGKFQQKIQVLEKQLEIMDQALIKLYVRTNPLSDVEAEYINNIYNKAKLKEKGGRG